MAVSRLTTARIWQVLGLSGPTDIRGIKSAYAARLKENRPEDDPEAFQQLRAAYQAALALVKHEDAHSKRIVPFADATSLHAPDEKPPATETTSSKRLDDLALSETESAASPSVAADVTETDAFLTQLGEALSNRHTINDEQTWSFLDQAPSVCDLAGFDRAAGIVVNTLAAKGTGHVISSHTMQRLDDLFDLSGRIEELERRMDRVILQRALWRLPGYQKLMERRERLHKAYRNDVPQRSANARTFDAFAMIGAAAWLSIDSSLGFYWWIYIAFGCWALIEISPLRAPGKWIAGLVVRSMDGGPPSGSG